MIFARVKTRRSQIAAAALAALCLLMAASSAGWQGSARGRMCSGLIYGQVAVGSFAEVLRGIGGWLGGLSGRAGELREAEENVQRLNEDLLIAQTRLLDKERELKALRETLGVYPRDVPDRPELVPARIVGRDATNWPGIVVLDRGSSDGIVVGSGVICGKSAVGVVAATRPSASVVNLLTHPDCRVAAILPRTSESRHVKGTLTDTIRMLDVHERPVQPGDAVLTSGEMGVFPRGLLIGTVVEASAVEGSLIYDVSVRPTARLSTAYDVHVVLPRGGDALEIIRDLRN